MVERLSVAELREKLQDGDGLQVLDTRPADTYATGHLPGAENVPYAELADRIADIEFDDEVVLVCQEGVSSVQAGRLLESYEGIDDGTRIASLDGGYDEWDGDLESET